MTAVTGILLLCVVALIAVNAFFVAVEFAFVTVDRSSVRMAVENGEPGAANVERALSRLSTHLSGAQLGITVSSLIVGYIAEPSVAAVLKVPLAAAGLPEAAAFGVSMTLAFIVTAISQMVLGELFPKNWALAQPLRLAKWVAPGSIAFCWVMHWPLAFFNGTANGLVRLLGMEPQEELASARNPQELSAIASRSAREGTLDTEVARKMTHGEALGRKYATDAMTPRAQILFVDIDASVAEVLEACHETGYSRMLVTGEHADDVRGVVHFKHALEVPRQARATTPVRQIIRDVVEVPDTMPLDNVLNVLRDGLQIAVVIDEYGGTDGLITLEDLVEELVGEIADEQDAPEQRWVMQADGSVELMGMLRPDEIRSGLGIELPEGDTSETIGGLITERLERFAEEGDVVEFEGRDFTHRDDDDLPSPVQVELTVTRMAGRRVDLLTLKTSPIEEDDA